MYDSENSGRSVRLGLAAAGIVILTAVAIGGVVVAGSRSKGPAVAKMSRQPKRLEPPPVEEAPPADDESNPRPSPVETEKPSPPSTPAPQPLVDRPEVRRARTAIMSHGWWKPAVSTETVERIIDVLTNHGTGFAFINQRGDVAWIDPTAAGYNGMP